MRLKALHILQILTGAFNLQFSYNGGVNSKGYVIKSFFSSVLEKLNNLYSDLRISHSIVIVFALMGCLNLLSLDIALENIISRGFSLGYRMFLREQNYFTAIMGSTLITINVCIYFALAENVRTGKCHKFLTKKYLGFAL